jgi:hypothetical protein
MEHYSSNEKSKQSQKTNPNVAQPPVAKLPSAVVIHPGPKGRPDFCPLPFTFLLYLQNEPNSFYIICAICGICGSSLFVQTNPI